MSHYTEVKLAIKDQDALLEALRELGFSGDRVEVHEESVALHGWGGGLRPQRAHVVIPRKKTGLSASNDIGFERLADGTYKAHISEYDSHTFDARWVNRLTQLAGVHAATSRAQALGHQVKRIDADNGQIKLVVTGRL